MLPEIILFPDGLKYIFFLAPMCQFEGRMATILLIK